MKTFTQFSESRPRSLQSYAAYLQDFYRAGTPRSEIVRHLLRQISTDIRDVLIQADEIELIGRGDRGVISMGAG